MKIKKVVIAIVLVFLFGSMILVSACEPGGDIIVKNQSSQEVTFYISSVRDDGTTDELTPEGAISANSTNKFPTIFLGSNWVNRITIKNSSGNIVFVHDYKMADLDKIQVRQE